MNDYDNLYIDNALAAVVLPALNRAEVCMLELLKATPAPVMVLDRTVLRSLTNKHLVTHVTTEDGAYRWVPNERGLQVLEHYSV